MVTNLAMTKGSGYADGRHGKGRLFQRGRVWWVQYYAHGQMERESSRSDKKAVAEKLLMRRLVQSEDGTAPVKQRPISYEEMRQRLVTQRLIDHPRLSKALSRAGLKNLDAFFAKLKSSVITEDKIQEFIVARQATGGLERHDQSRSGRACGRCSACPPSRSKRRPTSTELCSKSRPPERDS